MFIERSALVGRTQSKTAVLEAIVRCNARNLTGTLDFNKFGIKDEIGLIGVTPKFVDNFVIDVIAPDYHVTKSKYKFVGAINKAIRELLDDSGLEKCPVKAIGIRKLDATPPQHRVTKIPFYDSSKEAEVFYSQEFKVSTPDIKYDTVMQFLRSREYEEIGMQLRDFDVTRDYAGTFSKDDAIEHMVKQLEFRMQGEEDFDAKRTILDNDRLVGRNCLTYMENVSGYATRQKLYNKFVQSLEAQSVRSSIGSHWRDWIVQKNTRLAMARDLSTKRGLTRAEVTFYLGGDDKVPDDEVIETVLLGITDNLPKQLIYSTPFADTWRVYCDTFIHSLVCVDTKEDIALLVYSLNEITGKISGQLIEGFSEKWRWILRNLTLNGNLPIDVIDINLCCNYLDSNRRSDTLLDISGSRVYKSSSSGNREFTTRMVSNKGCFSYTKATDAQLFEMHRRSGIEEHPNCKPLVANRGANAKSKADFTITKVENLNISILEMKPNRRKTATGAHDLIIEELLTEEAATIDEARVPLFDSLDAMDIKSKRILEAIASKNEAAKSHLKNLPQAKFSVMSAKRYPNAEYGAKYQLVVEVGGELEYLWSNWSLTMELDALLASEQGKTMYDEPSGYLIQIDKPIGELTIKGKILNRHGYYTVFCKFEPLYPDPNATTICALRDEVETHRQEAKNLQNQAPNLVNNPIPVQSREHLIPYKEYPPLSDVAVGSIKRLESIGWLDHYGSKCLVVELDGIWYQSGKDLQGKVDQLTLDSYVKIDKLKRDNGTKRNYPIVTVVRRGDWHLVINYSKTPMLTKLDGSTKVIDVKEVDVKGKKRKLLLTEGGNVFKLKKSKLEETVQPGYV